MKTVKNNKTNEIKRVNDIDADRLTRGSSYSYVPKSEWKKTKTVKETK